MSETSIFLSKYAYFHIKMAENGEFRIEITIFALKWSKLVTQNEIWFILVKIGDHPTLKIYSKSVLEVIQFDNQLIDQLITWVGHLFSN